MMDCTNYRRAILAEPHHPSAEMRSHVAGCHDCTDYTERLLRFDSLLGDALRVRVPTASAGEGRLAGAAAPLRLGSGRSPRPRARRWMAMAASILVAVVVAGSLWVALPRDTLAADVANHMAGEPDAWSRTAVPVPETQLDRVLADSQVRLAANAGLVSYASSCLFRGHRVPHLVVQTSAGPVTVMILTHEDIRRSERFNEQGYRGVLVPVPGHGSLAVLERGANAPLATVEEVAAHVAGAIEWTR